MKAPPKCCYGVCCSAATRWYFRTVLARYTVRLEDGRVGTVDLGEAAAPSHADQHAIIAKYGAVDDRAALHFLCQAEALGIGGAA